MARFLLVIPDAMPLFWKIMLWAAIALLPGGVLLLPFALGRAPRPAEPGARALSAPRQAVVK